MKLTEKQIREIWKKLRRYRNVIGFDATLRPRIKNGKEIPGQLVLRVYVSKKVPRSLVIEKPTLVQRIKHVFDSELMFSSDLVPSKLEGFETDVVEIGEIRALYDDPKQKYRPVVAGISACHANLTACTISGFFRTEDGKILVASNNHCFALENKAKKGDPLLQPSPYDKGTLEDTFATLHSFVEIKFNEFSCPVRRTLHKIYKTITRRDDFNRVDIAFGLPVTGISTTCLNIPIAFKGTAEAEIGMKVRKMGRTTGYTEGTVVSTDWTGQVQYSRGTVTFTDCILIYGEWFSAGGDSGSPVFDMNGNMIGVLFAGSDYYTVVCKIKNIEKEARVTLVTIG